MKEDGITLKQAKARYPFAILEVIVERPSKFVHRRFLQITPKAWREVPEGLEMTDVNARGPIRTIGYISKVRQAKQYWELVYILSDEWDLPISAVRKRIKDKIEGGASIERIVYETAKYEFRRKSAAEKGERTKRLRLGKRKAVRLA
jgi:hypothetical protein